MIEDDYDGLLGGDTQPAWGPGGKRIVFTRSDSLRMASGPYVYDLFVLDAASGKIVRRLTKSGASTPAAWSPDGKQLAFVDRHRSIALTSAIGTGLKELARGFDPAWSPDGKLLVFADAQGIEIMRANGSGKRLLLKCSACGEPDWQPLP